MVTRSGAVGAYRLKIQVQIFYPAPAFSSQTACMRPSAGLLSISRCSCRIDCLAGRCSERGRSREHRYCNRTSCFPCLRQLIKLAASSCAFTCIRNHLKIPLSTCCVWQMNIVHGHRCILSRQLESRLLSPDNSVQPYSAGSQSLACPCKTADTDVALQPRAPP
jgi:hypothetical protein